MVDGDESFLQNSLPSEALAQVVVVVLIFVATTARAQNVIAWNSLVVHATVLSDDGVPFRQEGQCESFNSC